METKWKSVDEVLAANPKVEGVSSGDGFNDSGLSGDDFADLLLDAGWRFVWSEANYHWIMEAPDGGLLGYVEGDLYHASSSYKGNGNRSYSIDGRLVGVSYRS